VARSGTVLPSNQDTPGLYATLETGDGTAMRVSYGTGKTAPAQTHSGARIPVAATGPQAAKVLGIHSQTELFPTLIGRRPAK
jgi:alkaline phosphatase